MANKLASVVSTQVKTSVKIYTVPKDILTTAFVTITNNYKSTTKIRLGISKKTTVPNSDWIEYDQEILSGGTYRKSGIICSEAESFYLYNNASEGSLSITIEGVETDLSKV